MTDQLALTKQEFAWLTQETSRRLRTLDSLLGGLTAEEYRQAKTKVVNECLEKIRKERTTLWE